MRKTADIAKEEASPLYERVAGDLARLIEQGTFRAGDRVPSVRALSRQLKVSVSTVLGAYQLLLRMFALEYFLFEAAVEALQVEGAF